MQQLENLVTIGKLKREPAAANEIDTSLLEALLRVGQELERRLAARLLPT